ncbi:MAG: cation-translocating P-type ATPase, partial [Oscillospiraceae bacterium]|nr:cation-translocating P-type ATPase [Oscillospiraceae bacterium]
IFENIKKSVKFLLSSNIGEVMTIFMGMVFGWEPPLVAIQLLWVNLVTDSLPAIALGLDPVEKSIMERKPRDPKKGLFADGMWTSICLEGGVIGGLALLAYSLGLNLLSPGSIDVAGTMAFCVLSLSQLFHAFNMRSDKSVLGRRLFENKVLVFSLILGIILQVAVVSVPQIASVFKVSPLSPLQWIVVGVLAFMPIVVVELQKGVSKKEN